MKELKQYINLPELTKKLFESQVREVVLREALSKCNSWAFEPDDQWTDKAKERYKNDMELVDKALAQTIPDGFGRRVAKSLLAHMEILKDVGYEEWADQCLDTLTPEDIALLEAMKGGGS